MLYLGDDLRGRAHANILARHRSQEGLPIALGHQALISEYENTAISGLANQPSCGLLGLQHRCGQHIAPPCRIVAGGALAGQRIGGLGER